MKNFVTPNETIRETDNLSIDAAIALAKETGVNRVVIPKHNDRTDKDIWMIEDTILLPDDIEIIVDNAHLMLADDTYINMFANKNLVTGLCRKPECEQKNITICGRGKALLDGGKYNGLHEKNSGKDGLPHISKNTMLFFVNVSNLTVENIKIANQRWWGVTNVFVHDAVYRNIAFDADLSRIDENGVHHPGEHPRNYQETYVKNADGIDLRIGCHHFVIENISGFTEDDTVALTALGKFETNQGYIVEGACQDIHDVKIKNIVSDPYLCSVVRLLNDNGHKLYNIDIDGVANRKIKTELPAVYTVRIGDMAYAEKHSELGDTFNISVKNVVSTGSHAVSLSKGLKDSTFENIVVAGEGRYGFGAVENGAVVENCTVKNILLAGEGSIAINRDNLTGELIEL